MMNSKVLLLILVFYLSFENSFSRGGRGGGSRGGGSRSSVRSGGSRGGSYSPVGSRGRIGGSSRYTQESSSFENSFSRGGRGGGSRGGGSRSSVRSGGSRGGSYSRVGSRGRIGGSSRYTSWSSSRGFSPSFRYKSTSYTYKRSGIYGGFIIMSPHQHRTFNIHSESAYNDISICYNEFPLYGRNLSQSPWFVCPWIDSSYRYCCGDEDEERCCRYFDRPGHLAGLIIGILIMVVIIVVTWHCLCKKRQNHKSSHTVVMYETAHPNTDSKVDTDTPYLAYSPAIQSDEVCPPYVAISDNQPYPTNPGAPYPTNPDAPYPTNPDAPYPTNPSAPYPVTDATGNFPAVMPNNPNQGALPYPSYGSPNVNQPFNTTQAGYDDTGPSYPLIPPEHPPPAYSEVVKH